MDTSSPPSTARSDSVPDAMASEVKTAYSPMWLFRNRWFKAAVFLLMCLANTIVYFGWSHFSKMLYRAGAYQWLCSPDDTASESGHYCEKQKLRVATLFEIGLSAESVLGAGAGYCYDVIGPGLTAVCGCIFSIIGWLFLGFSNQSAQMYIPGMICLAGAVNFIAYPAMSLTKDFPNWSGLVISLVVAAQTTGTLVAPVMKLAWDKNLHLSYIQVIGWYIGFVFLPLAILYVLCFPLTLKKREALEEPTSVRKENSGVKLLDKEDGIAIKGSFEPSEVRTVPTLWSQLKTVEFGLFSLYYVLQALQFGYYPPTVDQEFGARISDYQGYMMPFQGLFGALFGLLVQKTTTLPICLLLIVMMSLAYITATIRIDNVQLVTSVLYVVSNSYYYAVKYTYVSEMYSPDHFGSINGLIGCISGIIVLLNIAVRNANNYIATCYAYFGVGIFACVIVGVLWWRKQKGIHYRNDQVVQTKKSFEVV